VLFFFEVGFFVLALVAVVLAEAWGREPTILLWLVLTAVSLATLPLFQLRLKRRPAQDRRDALWRGAVVDSWRHFNRLMLLALAGLGAWWWVGAGLNRG
jgi:hypothetical protein